MALVGAVMALVAVGIAGLRSGVTGSVIHPIADDLTLYVWLLVPPVLLVRFAVAARAWQLAAAVWLILATPLVAAFSYAVGPYDAQPWWEAISGLLTATAGLCLLTAAAFSSRSRSHESAVTVVSPAPAGGAASPVSSGVYQHELGSAPRPDRADRSMSVRPGEEKVDPRTQPG